MIYIICVLTFVASICVLIKKVKQGTVLSGKCESIENIMIVDGSTASLYRCVFCVSYDGKSENIQIDCHWRPRKGRNYSIIYNEKRNKYILKNDCILIFVLEQLLVIIMLFISILETALLIKYR